MPEFELVSDLAPSGDQPTAIESLVEGLGRGDRFQTLLGITGSGKSFTIANVIARCRRPTLPSPRHTTPQPIRRFVHRRHRGCC